MVVRTALESLAQLAARPLLDDADHFVAGMLHEVLVDLRRPAASIVLLHALDGGCHSGQTFSWP